MPKGKRAVSRKHLEDHIACPHCGGELYIKTRVSKSRRQKVATGPKI